MDPTCHPTEGGTPAGKTQGSRPYAAWSSRESAKSGSWILAQLYLDLRG